MIPGLGLPGLGTGLPSMPGLGGLPSFPGLPGLGGPLGMPGMRPGMPPAAPNLAATLAAIQAGGGLPGMGAIRPGLGGMPGLRPGMPNLLRPPMVAPVDTSLSKATSKASAGTGPAGAVGMLAKAGSPAPLGVGLVPGSAAPASSAPAPCTVYVGRISSEVSDDFVRQLLEKCGTVTKWNRAADPNTSKLTSFGFCDFEAPQGVWRALECLHEKQLCDKRLLVKCEEKAKQTIDQWKEGRRAELNKERQAADGEAAKDPAKAGREAWAKAIAAAKKAQDGSEEGKEEEKKEEKKDGAEAPTGPLTDDQLQEKLMDESKDVSAAIAKLLQEKNKGYPELTSNDNEEATKDDEKVAEKELEKKDGEKDKENDKKNENEKEKAEDKDKDKGKDNDRKSEERGKKRVRTASEEKREKEKEEKERLKKAAVSRHYRPPRREGDRERRARDRDRDIEKEYQYRIREFERNEEHRIKNLKRDLRDLELTAPSEREIRKHTERDLGFGERESEEREWKRYREDRTRERTKEKEKDNADRAQVQREIDEEKKKKEAEEEEHRLKKKKEEDEKRREEEEEERRQQKEIEEAERKKREEEENEKRRIVEEEERQKNAEQKKIQEAAAAKLLLQVQEEMRNASAEMAAPKGPVVTGTVAGPDGMTDEALPAKHKPLVRAPDEVRAAPAAAAGGAGGAAVDAKLRDDEMRRLIQQVPTDKAKAFAFDIDWEVVHQSGIIEKKLRPWVRKKVTEFLGSEEQGMIEFIMRKVSSHTPPATILAELEGFIDEEAENFTLKMWRMLIFEVLRVKAR